MSISAGQKIAQYKMIRKIGSGGNAEVWMIEDNANKRFAMKILYFSTDNKFIKKYRRFQDEIKVVIENKDMEGIIPVFDSHLPDKPSTNNRPWYVMPLAKPITKIFNVDTDIKKIVLCVIDLLIILKKLHDKGIVHRDIKPANLYLYKERWCFGDFGLVDYPNKDDLTDKWEAVGPKWTIAPEMKRNPDVADGKPADIYSMSKTLWILLTGQKFGFDGQYDEDNKSICLRSKFKNEYLVKLDELLKLSTSDNPLERPTADSFTDTLKEWLIIRKDFDKRNQSEWQYIIDKLFETAVPKRVEWEDKKSIIDILNILSNMESLNHTFLPDGGGLDLINAKESIEENCIEISFEYPYIIKPCRLLFENINMDYQWSYFRLETVDLEPKYDHIINNYEIVTEVEPGNYIEWIHGNYGYYDDAELPSYSRHVYRSLSGDYVIFPKASFYNQISDTYDGRHNKMNADQFREYNESLRTAYFEAIENKKNNPPQNSNEKTSQFNKKKWEELLQKNKAEVYRLQELLNIPIKDKRIEDLLTTDHENSMAVYTIDVLIQELTGRETIKYRLQKNATLKQYENQIGLSNYFNIECDATFHTVEEACSVIALLENYYQNENNMKFEVKMHRLKPPKHLFTKKEIKEVLVNGDDSLNNTLVITVEGYPQLVDYNKISYHERRCFAVRTETFIAYGNYVGKYSKLYHLDDTYLICLEGWLEHLKSGRSRYKDVKTTNSGAEELISTIKELSILN